MIGRSIGLVALAVGLMGMAPHPGKAPVKAPHASPQEIIDKSPATAWKAIDAEDLVVMNLADGNVVTYALAPFAPVHVANIRALVRQGYFDGASILRVQDDYVVQWGRPDEDPTKPTSIIANPPAEYEFKLTQIKDAKFRPLPYRDAYAPKAGTIAGWPAASDGKTGWLVHCYGMIGVARDNPPSTGDSTQLYTVIGHAPRHLDRNLAVVGRIVSGMAFLTDQKRGTGDLGFYTDKAQDVPIAGVRLASEMPAAERPAYQYMDTDSATFAHYLHVRANRHDAFYDHPAGGVDLCNVQVPARKKPA